MPQIRGLRITLLVPLLTALSATAWAGREWSPQHERRTGEETAKQILQETPEWANDEQRSRCQSLADRIAPHTDRPDVQYQIGALEVPPDGEIKGGGYRVQLLDTDKPNAFALPGGFIFVTRGLLEQGDPEEAYLAVQSDDELAAVIAHEMGHVCHYHGLKQNERAGDLMRGSLFASLAALLLGGGVPGAFQVLAVGQQVTTGVLNHYGVDFESEADRSAVAYLVKAGFNPTGLLTYMERLLAEQRTRAPVELGIYQTHPYPIERVQAIRREIRSHGVEVNRRAVTSWRRPEAMDALVSGKPGAVLMLWERTVYTFLGSAPSGETPAQRAEAAVRSLEEALGKGMQEYDLEVVQEEGAARLTAFGEPLFSVYASDLEDGQSLSDRADAAAHELRAALFGSTIGTRMAVPKG